MSGFKLVEDKHFVTELELLIWSPKMDLLLTSDCNGQVILFRLSWQKVWTIPQVEDNIFISALSWRLDGKVFSIGYNNGLLNLHNVEDASQICSLDFKSSIVALTWQTFPKNSLKTDEDSIFSCLVKEENFLMEVTSSSGDLLLILKQPNLSILTVALETNKCHFVASGFVDIGSVLISDSTLDQIVSMTMDQKLSQLCMMLKMEQNDKSFVSLDTSFIFHHHEDLLKMTNLFLELKMMMVELKVSVEKVVECHDEASLSLQSKFESYSKSRSSKAERSLCHELLRLLLYGTLSDDLKIFLEMEIFKPSLPKMALSVQTSYENMQKTMVTNVNCYLSNILNHLTELLGLARCSHKFKDLGLDEQTVEKLLGETQKLLVTCRRLQMQIIHNGNNFKLFHKWLYPTLVRLSGDSNVPKGFLMNQQDVQNVAMYIKKAFGCQDNIQLESVSSLLKEDKQIKEEKGEWSKYCDMVQGEGDENKKEKEEGLVKEVQNLNKKLSNLMKDCAKKMSSSFKKNAIIVSKDTELSTFYSSVDPILMTLQPEIKENYFLFGGKNSLNFITWRPLVQSSFKSFNVRFKDSLTGEFLIIKDASFYNFNTLSVLFSRKNDTTSSYFLQSDIKNIFTSVSPQKLSQSKEKNETVFVEVDTQSNEKITEMIHFHAEKIIVSGLRKVAGVLGAAKRRIKLYLLEVGEDEEDEDDEERDVELIQE